MDAAEAHDVFEVCEQCRDEIQALRRVVSSLLTENDKLRTQVMVLTTRDPEEDEPC